MKDEKSFLDSLAKDVESKKELQNKEKPGSYKEEVFHRIEKPKMDKKVWIIGGVIALLAIVGIWFLFLAPKITVPDFQGQTVTDVSNWAKQYGIQTSSVVLEREYNFDYDEDTIISQSHDRGSKIHKDTPLTFLVSNGPDPEELITFPSIKEMSQDEIQEWIDINKLSKTKISLQYSTTVAEGEVISYELKTIEESAFKRGATLTIVVSKGVAPLQDVTIVDYVGKTFEEFKTWADGKGLVINKQDGYSETVEVGKVISQSLSAGTVVKQGDSITVVVSQGEAVIVPNLVGYTADMLKAWMAQNSSIQIITKEEYNKAALGTVIEQSVSAGTRVEEGDVVVLTTSLYMPQLMTNSQAWVGKDYLELLAWVDDANAKGASISAGVWGGEICPDDADAIAGQIVEMECMDSAGNTLPYNENGCARPLPLDAKISLTIVEKGCLVTP
ncbi:MAG: PASTA domain-containing protein [Anaerorhabdus sp.]